MKRQTGDMVTAEIMFVPPRAGHFPDHKERSALDKLRSDRELSVLQLHPTGLTTLSKMIQKGWIERVGENTVRITSAGKSALKARLPT